MLRDVVDVIALSGHRLAVTFDDGVSGVIELAEIVPFDGVFAALRSEAEFRRVSVNRELGSICWPCGADLDTQVLYARIRSRHPENRAPAAS